MNNRYTSSKTDPHGIFHHLSLKVMPISSRIMLHSYPFCVKGNITYKYSTECKREINSYVLLDIQKKIKYIFKALSSSYYGLTYFSGHFALETRYESQITTQSLNQC